MAYRRSLNVLFLREDLSPIPSLQIFTEPVGITPITVPNTQQVLLGLWSSTDRMFAPMILVSFESAINLHFVNTKE